MQTPRNTYAINTIITQRRALLQSTINAEDFQNQLTYIAQNPTRRHLQNHPWVHTNYPNKIDPIPTHFLK